MTRIAVLVAAVVALGASSAQAQCFGGATPDLGGGRPHLRFAPLAHASNVTFCGGSVMHSQRVHVIYWTPAGTSLSFDSGYEAAINTFIARASAASHSPGNVFGLMGQYGNADGPAAYDMTFAGAVIDTDPLPADSGSKCAEPLPPPLGVGPPGWTACVDDEAIQVELARVLRANGLPTGLQDMYLMLTPNGLGSCFGAGPSDCALGGDANQGFCGYHSATGSPGILYGVIPYNAVPGHCQSDNPRPNGTTADPTISTVEHEIAEIATDPVNDGWSDGSGDEIADLCITNYGPNLGGSSGATAYDEVIDGGHYYIQELWSNFSRACKPYAQPDSVSIVAPRRVAGDRTVQFTSRAVDPQGKIAGYRWSFGDHRIGHAIDPTHPFLSLGRFTVVLRVTDSWGNWAYGTTVVTVRRPRRPDVRLTRARVDGARAAVRFRSDAAVVKFQCRLDGGSWIACRSPFTTPRLAAGGHRLEVRARDSFGQLSARPAGFPFTVA